MLDRNYYVFCDNNCKFVGMTKEQILAAISQAVSSGTITDVDSGFVTTIKEQNSNSGLVFWVGTQAQYNALTEKVANCLYLITDDTTVEDLETAIANISKIVNDLGVEVASIKGKTDTLEATVSEHSLYFGNMMDWVGDHGFTDDWNWRKWYNSGYAEMWKSAGYNSTIKAGSHGTFSFTFPFEYSEIPTVTVSVVSLIAIKPVVATVTYLTTTSANITVHNVSDTDITNYALSIYINGNAG